MRKDQGADKAKIERQHGRKSSRKWNKQLERDKIRNRNEYRHITLTVINLEDKGSYREEISKFYSLLKEYSVHVYL